MLLGYAGCNGREPQLANCSGVRYNRPISQTCDNTRVAGVRCLGMLRVSEQFKPQSLILIFKVEIVQPDDCIVSDVVWQRQQASFCE